jgi:hypothetical protein
VKPLDDISIFEFRTEGAPDFFVRLQRETNISPDPDVPRLATFFVAVAAKSLTSV